MRYLISAVLLLAWVSVSSQTQQKKIDSLNNAISKSTTETNRASLINEKAEAYLSINLDSSVALFNQVVKIARDLEDPQLEFTAYNGLGRTYTNRSKHDSANVYLKKAEALLEYNDSYDPKTTLWMNQGILFFMQSKYDDAKSKFQDILTLALETGNIEDQSRCYNNIALCNQYTGNFEDALKMHIESAKLAEAEDDKASMAKSYNNIGLVYFDLGDYNKSEEYILRSLELKESLGDKVGMIGGYLNLGNSFRKVGMDDKIMEDLTKAKEYYKRALDLSEETNYGRGRNNAIVNLALVETTMENFDKGVEYGKLAVKLASESGDRAMETAANLNLGDTYRFKRQFDLAEEYLLKGLRMATEDNNLYVKQEALLMLNKLYADKGNYKAALAYHEDFVTLKDSIASVDVKNNINELETRYESEKKEKELAETRADLAERELEVRQKNTMLFGLIGLALVLALIGYLFYNQQRLKNRQLQKESELKSALAKIETQNRLQEQRLRISRDLHDNIGSQLTFIISSIDSLKFGLKDASSSTTSKLSKISEFTTHTIYELRDTIWAMNKNDISWEDLQVRISNFIENAAQANNQVDFTFEMSERVTTERHFSSIRGVNVYRMIQEAVNNALKYANASAISVLISETQGNNSVIIKDNGVGFELSEANMGNGIANIRKRAKDLNGNAEIVSKPGEGTSVKINFPTASNTANDL